MIQNVGQTTNSLNNQVIKTATMSNEEIAKRAYEAGDYAYKNKASNKLLKALPALAVAGVALASGIATKGKLSNKTRSALYTVGTFTVVSLVYDAVHKGINKFKQKNDTIKRVDENYPLLGAFAKIGVAFGASVVALKGLRKSSLKLAEKFPNVTQGYKKMSKGISDILDKSKLNNVTEGATNALRNVARKYPKMASFVKRNSFLLMIAGYLGASTLLVIKNEKNKQKAAQAKAEELLAERTQAQDVLLKAQALKTTEV